MHPSSQPTTPDWLTDAVAMDVRGAAGRQRMLAGRPLGPLRPFIEQIWYSEGPLDTLTERVMPSATGDIVLNLGPAMHRIDAGAEQVISGGTLSGLFRTPMVLQHPTRHRAVGVRLTPFALPHLLGLPTGEVNDAVVTLDAVLPARADRRITEHCAEQTEPQQVVASFLSWLERHHARRARTPDPIVVWTVAQIQAQHGAVSISALQRESGYGATRFIARFKAELGMTPKTFARLVRFRAALDRLRTANSLAALALDLGYTDQAHMGADFRRFAGRTPTEILGHQYLSGVTMADTAA